MLSARTRLFPSRLFAVLGLILLISTSTGCATRALMSSDRYEKPEQEPQQFRSSDEISGSWQPGSLTLEQRYLATIKSGKDSNQSI